jgi:hypothetical protein
MRSCAAIVLAVSSVSLAACGGSGSGDDVITTVDGRSIDSSSSAVIDAPSGACAISTTSFGDKGMLAGTAGIFRPDTSNAALYSVEIGRALEAAAPPDVVYVSLYNGFGPFGTEAAPTPVRTGTFPLTGGEQSFATCGVCVVLSSNFVNGTGGDSDYMPTGGMVTINAVTPNVGGAVDVTLTNVTLQHVIIDPANFATAAVGDGCTTSITNARMSGTLAAPTAKLVYGPAPRLVARQR